MSPKFTAIAILGTAALLAGCTPLADHASAAADAGRACFLPRQIDSFAAQGIDRVNLRHNQDYYRLNLAENCPEIQESDAIRVRSRTGSSFVCAGEAASAEVVAMSKVTGPRRCLIRDVQKLDPTEVASLSGQEKP